MAEEISVLKEAREIVRSQPMDLYIGHLRSCADALHESYDLLKISCTRSAVREFIAAFTRTILAIEKVHEHTPTTPSGGRQPVPSTTEEALTAHR